MDKVSRVVTSSSCSGAGGNRCIATGVAGVIDREERVSRKTVNPLLFDLRSDGVKERMARGASVPACVGATNDL